MTASVMIYYSRCEVKMQLHKIFYFVEININKSLIPKCFPLLEIPTGNLEITTVLDFQFCGNNKHHSDIFPICYVMLCYVLFISNRFIKIFYKKLTSID